MKKTNEIYRVQKNGNRYVLATPSGQSIGTLGVNTGARKRAYEEENALQVFLTKNGRKQFRQVPMDVFNMLVAPLHVEDGSKPVEAGETRSEVTNFIHKESLQLKPRELVISELKWRYLVRSAVRGKNIMMLGHAGTGKTMAAKALTQALDRPGFIFNLGSTQDPRATLIGNTQFSNDKGTFFSQSAFVKAITTPNAVILLDEITRAHPDAWNILMPVLDQGQRVLRLDEAEGSPTVNVAEGVTFIATANVGTEYTSTRILDRAIMDRFVTIEMDLLNADEELDLLKFMFPDVNREDLNALAEIAHHTRLQIQSEDPKVTSIVSTRATVEAASLLYDGFSFLEACEITVLPVFSNDGGIDSERTYVKQLVQKYIRTTADETLFNTDPTTEAETTNTTINW
jgi:MoxR-like ATPase